MSRASVLIEVSRERDRQEAKFPGQSLPDGTVANHWRMRQRERQREFVDERAKEGTLTWLDVLNEEVAEAACEGGVVPLREELIQVAAVAVRWVEDIDGRSKG